jgi:tetratricopeptide (TPR) repeat protein
MLAPPDRGGTLINRGVIKLRRGQFEAAHVDFDAGIALIPEVGEGWINRGAMFVGEHKYRDGLGDLDKGLTLGVKEPEKAYFNRALAHEGLDDEKAAYLDFQQASTLKPDWDAPKQELKRFTVSTR